MIAVCKKANVQTQLINIRNAIPTASISTPKIRNASIKLVTIDFYFSPTEKILDAVNAMILNAREQ